jgi:hypothetical protein
MMCLLYIPHRHLRLLLIIMMYVYEACNADPKMGRKKTGGGDKYGANETYLGLRDKYAYYVRGLHLSVTPMWLLVLVLIIMG